MEASPFLPVGGQTVTWWVTNRRSNPEGRSAAPTSGTRRPPCRPAVRSTSRSLRPGPMFKGSSAHSVTGSQPHSLGSRGCNHPQGGLPASSPHVATCPNLFPQPHTWWLGGQGPGDPQPQAPLRVGCGGDTAGRHSPGGRAPDSGHPWGPTAAESAAGLQASSVPSCETGRVLAAPEAAKQTRARI